MKRLAVLSMCLAAVSGLGGCGSGSTAEAGPTQATIARLTVTIDGQPTGDVWVAVSGLGGGVEPVETIDGSSGEALYTPGQLRWTLIHLTREFPGPANDVVQTWIDESLAGQKPQGVLGIQFVDASGQETSRWEIERWHMESFEIGPFNSKESSELTQTVTIRTEKITKA